MVKARRWRHRLPIAALAALLGGCAVGPDFVRPAAPTTPGYTAEPPRTELAPAVGGAAQRLDPAQEISSQWWELFRSPPLDAVVVRSLQDNRTLAAARATLAQAQEAVAAARGGFFPQLDLGGNAQRQRSARLLSNAAVSSPSQVSTLYSVGPTVSYLVDVFGAVRRSVEQQEALAEFQHDELAAAWLTLSGNAVTESISIASLRAQIEAVEDVVADDQSNLDLVQRKYEAGKVARTDVLTAATQLASDRAQLPPLRQQLAAARHALSVLAGQPPAEWSPPEFALDGFELPQELPLSLPSELVRQRPDILAAEAQLHASSAAIGVATAQLYPSLTLSGSLTQEALDAGSFFTGAGTAWVLAAHVAAPLFHGGTLRAQRRAAIDACQASLATYEQTVLQAFQQVADTLRALGHDAELVDAQKQNLDIASESLALQRISYEAGKTDVLLLLVAQRAYAQARLGLAEAQGQRLVDTALLFVGLGGGWWQAKL
jgi:NodT family efflux transporter outer membrane factor (OMF) lipoprotein